MMSQFFFGHFSQDIRIQIKQYKTITPKFSYSRLMPQHFGELKEFKEKQPLSHNLPRRPIQKKVEKKRTLKRSETAKVTEAVFALALMKKKFKIISFTRKNPRQNLQLPHDHY